MAFWINIYGCQSCPRMTICVVNQLKNNSYCYGLYAKNDDGKGNMNVESSNYKIWSCGLWS